MPSFEPNAILRGAQLTLVGAHRALQNPAVFKHQHYRQAALAVAAGVGIRVLLAIPVLLVRAFLWFLDLFTNLEAVKWDDQVIDSLNFLQHSVLQVPFFLMSLMKYLSPALDDMFMESLCWVDRTYYQKHASEDPSHLRATYYPNLRLYSTYSRPKANSSISDKKKAISQGLFQFLMRYGRRAGISLAIYLLAYVPYVGRFVLPAASFYTFNKAVGLEPAVAIFATGIFLPKRYLIIFLQTYFSSRSLMRELQIQLVPYFSRIHFTKAQKQAWFRDREGVLFGFGVGFFVLVKIPLVGVLVYGIAEASTAYLITKITDPPAPPQDEQQFVESQLVWRNKHEFLGLGLAYLDALNVQSAKKGGPAADPLATELPTKKFT